jgi:hypothetical protein
LLFPHDIQVAGTLAASGLNNFGIAGMIPDEHVCLVICRIFGDYGGVSDEKLSISLFRMANTEVQLSHTLMFPNSVHVITQAGIYTVADAIIVSETMCLEP